MNVYLAEFIGTAIIIFFGGGVVANVSLTKSKAQGAGWMVITAAWALGITTAVYTVGWISGAHLNPALSIALAVIGALKWEYLLGYIVAQILGAMFGSLLVFLTFKLHFDEEENQEALLGIFCTGPAIRNYFWNVVTEILATAMFVFGVLGIGNAKNTAVAFTLSNGAEASGNIGMSFGGPTGYAINPARDLGPRIMHAILPIKHKGSSDWAYAWVPIVAPIIGAVAGALLYTAVFN